uniref:Dentin sialophosphoprotein-like n=1 Tax=Noccaea caerulescens TaxID=107243 RepID=A0A1J3JX58_NOCCA
MEEQREESEFLGDTSSKTQTLDGEDDKTVEVSDSGVCDVREADGSLKAGAGNAPDLVADENQVKSDVGSVEDMAEKEDNVEESGEVETEDNVEKTVSSDDVGRTDAITELETERNGMDGDDGTVEVEPLDETEGSDLRKDVQRVSETAKLVDVEMNDETARNGASRETAGEEETVASAGNEVTAEKAKCEVEENGGACEKSQPSSVDGEMLSVADQEKESEKQRNLGSGPKDAIHSESAQVPEEPAELSNGEWNEENPGAVSEVNSATEICLEEEITQNEENGEGMEIDYAAEEHMGEDVEVGRALNNGVNESSGATVVQTQVEADENGSNVVNEMEIDEQKDNVDMATDLTDPNSPSEDAATGNIQDNVSLKEDKKAIDMPEEVATVDCKEALRSGDATVNAESHDNLSLSAQGIQNESSEACVSFGAESPREASDAIMESDENQEEQDHEGLDQNSLDQQDALREGDGTTREAPSIDPNQKEDTEVEEDPNSSDYGDDGTDSDIRTNGVKRKADVLSEDSPGEGRKTVSLAKVSFAQRPSFKIGACIARAASQMAGSTSVLKGSNIGDETLSVESFVSQLHCAATDPVKENVVSEIAAGFFLDFRNSSASQQVSPEKVGGKRGRPSNSNAGGTEAFEFEEMGDTYWTDRVIHNGGEEQAPPTEKGSYQVVPVELKSSQVKRTRRPYKRRQSQISVPLPSASDKPADFDENAPAELIMKFSETDTIPPEKSLSKMFRHFGPIKESQTEVDKENNRARVVFRKGADAEVAYNSAGRFKIFGTKAVNYELSFTITEAFKVQPYVVSLGEENAALSLPS